MEEGIGKSIRSRKINITLYINHEVHVRDLIDEVHLELDVVTIGLLATRKSVSNA